MPWENFSHGIFLPAPKIFFSGCTVSCKSFRMGSTCEDTKGKAAGSLKEAETESRRQIFCRTYLQTMDPQRAARTAGCRDGFSTLGIQQVQKRLDEMRETAAAQICREDILRRLAQLAFGPVNDAVRLALEGERADLEELDLSAVSEFKVTDKGVEIRFVDRLRALEALGELLEDKGGGAQELYQALAEAAGEEGGWEHG